MRSTSGQLHTILWPCDCERKRVTIADDDDDGGDGDDDDDRMMTLYRFATNGLANETEAVRAGILAWCVFHGLGLGLPSI